MLCLSRETSLEALERDKLWEGGRICCDLGLDLSGSWQQRPLCHVQCPVANLSRLQRILLIVRLELYFRAFVPVVLDDRQVYNPCHVPLGAKAPTYGRRANDKLRRRIFSVDSDLEAFSHNPAHGSFAPLAFQPSAMTNCVNQRFLSY